MALVGVGVSKKTSSIFASSATNTESTAGLCKEHTIIKNA